MEVKVWMDGYQRIVCGVTEQTTCQDLIVALAQASGVTGRYAMYERWRTTENCLSPAEYPLVVLRRWGDYSHDVHFILRHSSGPAIDGKKVRGGVEDGCQGPPERPTALKKSLTISGAHGRAQGVEPCPRNNVGHSVDSSEQSSVASHSSASLSPCTSLERRNVNRREVTATYNGQRTTDNGGPVESVRVPIPAERRSVVSAENFSGTPPKPQPAGGLKTQVPRPGGGQGVAGEKLLRFDGTRRISVGDNSGSDGTSLSSSPVVSQPSKGVLLHVNRQMHDANSDRDHQLVTQSSTTSKAPILGSSILKLVATSKSQQNRGRHPVQDSEIKDPAEQRSTAIRTLTAEDQQQQHPHPPAKKFQIPKGAWAYPLPHFPPPPTTPTPPPPAAEATAVSSGAVRNPHSTSPVESRSSSESSAGSERPESMTSGAEEREREMEREMEREREERRRREMVELIRAQNQELRKCESRLKELDCEISLMEGDAEVEERHLEAQLRKIEEMEALEKAVDSELEELELISWEEKLELERQKEVRIQTEILLLQSGIEKSESKIKEITSKTEDATKEFNRRLLEKQGKEKQDIEDLEEILLQEKMLLQVSSKSLKSLEQEIVSVDKCLLRKKEDLSGLEDQLKQLNMELFLKQATQDTSPSGRSPLLDQLGLLRPSERVHPSHVIEGPLPPPHPLPRRLKCTLVEARGHSPEFV